MPNFRKPKYIAFHSCLTPKRVVRSDGQVLYVSCGTCPSCLNRRASALSTRCQEECKQHVYSIFFTLTYDNDNIPYYQAYQNDDANNSDVIFSCANRDDMPFISFRSGTNFSLAPAPEHSHINGFGVCCKSDVQKFVKRLRRKIDYHEKTLSQDEKSLRYFIASEYGPRTLRPHYHGIIWTDNALLAQHLANYIRASWKMCNKERIDVQFVTNSAPQYVAKYINGNSYLPSVLRVKPTRPFYLCSQSPTIGLYKVTFEDAAKVLNTQYLTQDRTDEKDKCVYTTPVSASFINRFWPKCYRFNDRTFEDKLRVYSWAYFIFKQSGLSFVEWCNHVGVVPYPKQTHNPHFIDACLLQDIDPTKFPEHYARSVSPTSKYCYAPLSKTFTSQFSDVHTADYVATLACLRWCLHFNVTPYDYVLNVCDAHKKRQMYLLKQQFEYEDYYCQTNGVSSLAETPFRCSCEVNDVQTLVNGSSCLFMDREIFYQLPRRLPTLASPCFARFKRIESIMDSRGMPIMFFYDADGCLIPDRVRLFDPINDALSVTYCKYQESQLIMSNKSKKLHDLEITKYPLFNF